MFSADDDLVGQTAIDMSLIGTHPVTCYVPLHKAVKMFPQDPFELPQSMSKFGHLANCVGLILSR